MNQKCAKQKKLGVKKTLQVQFAHLSEQISTAGLHIRVKNLTFELFKKRMELYWQCISNAFS